MNNSKEKKNEVLENGTFVEFDINEHINNLRKNDPDFADYDEFLDEYAIMKELVKVRKELSITQSEIAERTGMKQQMISRIEGGTIPNLSSFMKLVRALGLKVKIEKDPDSIFNKNLQPE